MDLAHVAGCGAALYRAGEAGARLINHPTIGHGTAEGPRFGAIAALVFRDGPVSLLRIARDGGALFAMTAMARGLEHHFALVRDHHAGVLAEFG